MISSLDQTPPCVLFLDGNDNLFCSLTWKNSWRVLGAGGGRYGRPVAKKRDCLDTVAHFDTDALLMTANPLRLNSFYDI